MLKKYGAPVKDLLKFYCSVIRSVLEYGDILWHGGLTLSQSQDIERIQKRALRIITPDLSYEDALVSSKLLPLHQRRNIHCSDLKLKTCPPRHINYTTFSWPLFKKFFQKEIFGTTTPPRRRLFR